MFKFFKDRKFIVFLVFATFFLILIIRLANITIIHGEEYYKKSLDIRLKKKNIISRRGNIYDRNGKLLAENINTYSLEFLADKRLSKKQEKMIITLFNKLDEDDEDYLKLPIILKNGDFYYKKQKDKEKWLIENGFDIDTSASKVIDFYRDREYISESEDYVYVMKILNSKNIFLPVDIINMRFTYDNGILRFLKNYNIKEYIEPKEAFLRLRKFYNIDEKYSDKEAYFLITIKDAIRSKGYLIYEPIKIAKNISKDNVIYFQERSIDFPNINISVDSYRHYPYNEVASHILGYMGYISTDYEIEKYSAQNGYNKDDMIGKTGLEGKFEEVLRGKNGHNWIEVDSRGNFVKNIDNTIPDDRFKDVDAIAGKDVSITIDIDFQKKVQDITANFLKTLREGGIYKSKFGNVRIDKKYKYANTAAVVVQDVKNGEILSLVSYPNYDVNMFSRGISTKDWESLQPKNPKNPLEPKPLYNLATMTAVQPGSTFKMVTALAALNNGLDPNLKLRDAGVIRTKDNRTFACWAWNMFGSNHGFVDLKRALGVSCNYYFYDISAGYDFANGIPLNFKMGIKDILNTAQVFGLGSPTGIEIGETFYGLPDVQNKKNISLYYLGIELNKILKKYVDIEVYDNDIKIANLVNEIVLLCKQNSDISKQDLFNNLMKIIKNSDENKIDKLTDIIKYSYLNDSNWSTGDGFNLAIGQGANAYTPVQMARYISTIANGGYLYDTTIIKNIQGEEIKRNSPIFIDEENNLDFVKEGMYYVANVNDNGTSSRFLYNFPIKMGAKTGTAEKEGKQPSKDEAEYILKNLKRIAPMVDKTNLEEKTTEILKERIERISNAFEIMDNSLNELSKLKIENELNSINMFNYLSREYAMREALKILTNYEITDDQIDEYKQEYENFSWFVAFAPYDEPEIAIVTMIPQGGSGLFGAVLCREIVAAYYNLD